MRIMLTIFLLFALGSTGDCMDRTTRSDSLVNAADESVSRFNNVEACRLLEEAAALNPDDFDLACKRIAALCDAGEDINNCSAMPLYRTALSLAKSLNEKYPDEADSYYYRAWAAGHVALHGGNKERILLATDYRNCLAKALEIDSSHARAHLALGIYYREVASLPWIVRQLACSLIGALPPASMEDALIHIRRFIQYCPDSMAGYVEMGKTCELTGDLKTACGAFRKILEMPINDHLDGRKIAYARARINVIERKGLIPVKMTLAEPHSDIEKQQVDQ